MSNIWETAANLVRFFNPGIDAQADHAQARLYAAQSAFLERYSALAPRLETYYDLDEGPVIASSGPRVAWGDIEVGSTNLTAFKMRNGAIILRLTDINCRYYEGSSLYKQSAPWTDRTDRHDTIIIENGTITTATGTHVASREGYHAADAHGWWTNTGTNETTTPEAAIDVIDRISAFLPYPQASQI